MSAVVIVGVVPFPGGIRPLLVGFVVVVAVSVVFIVSLRRFLLPRLGSNGIVVVVGANAVSAQQQQQQQHANMFPWLYLQQMLQREREEAAAASALLLQDCNGLTGY